ncbi:polysaccharide biosynthesis protein [Cohnella xylanilytica]|uniref:flippase n=1 Tax=Cohnella xylanilytica TaxID=557555 RepID=UPI001B216D28|nr:flippase [Cohnella xylanilytica]GIO12249.1 polysaccharide biosynthesis protein [Cohnella xylanilytica]
MHRVTLLIKNFISVLAGNLVGQALGFITIVYLGRVLGPEGYGIINFAQSYIFYFYLATDIGLSLYITRELKRVERKEALYKEVFSIKFYLSILTSVIYTISVACLSVPMTEKSTLWVLGTSIFFTGISVEGFFMALQKMKYIGMSTMLKNLVFCVLSFVLVKQENDVIYATLCITMGAVVYSFYLLIKFNKLYKVKLLGLPSIKYLKTIKAALPLTFSLLMIQINNNFDIIYLSFMNDNSIVGYYSAAYKIISFLIALLVVYFNSGYGTISELISTNKTALDDFVSKFFKIGVSLVIPVTIGGICLAPQIMTISFGTDYSNSGKLLEVLLILVFIRMVTSTYGAVLIMGNKSKQFSNGVTIGAVINILLNIALVPSYGAMGSAMATVLCEAIQGFYLYYYYRKDCNAKLFSSLMKPIIASLLMAVVIISIRINVIFEIIVGAVLYIIIFALLEYKLIKHIIHIKRGAVN